MSDDKIISAEQYRSEMHVGPRPEHFDYGYVHLDNLTDGCELGELLVFTGYSGHGKTEFTRQISENFGQSGISCLWLSYEVTPQQFFARFKNPPRFCLPKNLASADLNWIGDKIDEAKEKFKTKVIFIDHLHFLIDMFPSAAQNQSLVIGSLLRKLKRMALEKQVVICLIAHTGQPSDDKPPGMGSLRDSSFVVQESDAVFAVHRIKERKLGADIYTDKSAVIILKHRRKGTMGRQVKFDFKGGTYYEAIAQI